MIIYKMNIKNKKSFSIKKLVIPASILILIGGGAYAYALSNDLFQQASEGPEIQTYESPNDPVPQTPTNPTDNTNKENLNAEEPGQQDEQSPAILVTAASVNGDTLEARALIQAVISGGTCELMVKRNGQTLLSEVAEIQAGPSTSTCKGFTASLAGLESGPAQVTISYQSGDRSGTSQISEIAIE